MTQSNVKRIEKKEIWAVVVCLISSIVLLLMCSKNSPLYVINDWTDVSVMFTNGRRMLNGQVLYKDFYEHKGLYYCFLFELAAAVSGRSFIGLYIIEVIAHTVFLFFAYKTWEIYFKKVSFAYIFVFASLFISSKTLCQGGSAEELCLPFLMISIYIMVKLLHKDKGIINAEGFTWILFGIFTGIFFWIKYTLCMFFVGMCIFIAIYMFINKNILKLVEIALLWLLGMILISVPAFAYFGINGCLSDLWHVYGYNLIFAYNVESGEGGIVQIIRMLIVYPLFLLSGITAIKKKIFSRKDNAFILTVFLANYVYVIFIALKTKYVLLVFMPILAFWFAGLISVADKFLEKVNDKIVSIGLVSVFFVLAYVLSPNTKDIGKDKDDYVFYQFADIINQEKDATLLVYNAYEEGFYFASDIVPKYKYITDYNIRLDEITNNINEIVETKDATFVITVCEKPANVKENYDLLCKGQYKGEKKLNTYYLWKRK